MSRLEVLEQMPPFQGGGEMIQDVYLDHSTYAEPPSRFEAGTPGIAEAIGLGVACDYLTDIGMENIHRYEEELGGYLYQQVRTFLAVTHLSQTLGASACRLASQRYQLPPMCMDLQAQEKERKLHSFQRSYQQPPKAAA